MHPAETARFIYLVPTLLRGDESMKLGTFMMPNHPPHRSFSDGHEHDLDYLVFLDRLGFDEAWIGEHFTTLREPCPSPDLLVAQSLVKTKNIRVSTGGYVLPFHHPAELAHRIAWLDHISQGRCYAGVASGAIPTDWEMFDVDGAAGENRRMMEESLEIMLRFWLSEEPFEYKGKYWTARRPAEGFDENYSYHIKPFTKPHPQVAIAGFTANSPTLELCGRKGFIPLSFGFSNRFLPSHWSAVEKGAGETGMAADRSLWRIGRDIYVADSDTEARDKVKNGAVGDHYIKFWMPMLKSAGLLSAVKHDPDMPDSDVDLDYIIDRCMFVGSRETVENRIADMVEITGGCGCLLSNAYDHVDDMQGWRESVTILKQEIMPKFAHVS